MCLPQKEKGWPAVAGLGGRDTHVVVYSHRSVAVLQLYMQHKELALLSGPKKDIHTADPQTKISRQELQRGGRERGEMNFIGA